MQGQSILLCILLYTGIIVFVCRHLLMITRHNVVSVCSLCFVCVLCMCACVCVCEICWSDFTDSLAGDEYGQRIKR